MNTHPLPLHAPSYKISAVLFTGVLAIYCIEYIGLGHYLPGAQKIPLFLSLGIFLFVIFSKECLALIAYGQTKAFLLFLLHTLLSMSYAIVTTYAFNTLKLQIGYIILFFSTFTVLTSYKRIYFFLLMFVFFHCFIVLVNLDKLTSGLRIGSFKAGYFLGDGNDLAWSLTIFFPFTLYLLLLAKSKLLKCLFLFTSLLFLVGIIGTASRGAFLALLASFLYYIYTSKKRILAFSLIAAFLVLLFSVSPENYISRIHSITDYEEDSSALGRLMAWKSAVNMAIDNIFGVGAGNFNTAYGRFYRPEIVDPRIWSGARWISPHSIYFLVLGEYGFIGLLTILSILYLNFRTNHKQMNASSSFSTSLTATTTNLLPRYLNMSLFAFCIGGVFLGGINYPHLFVLTAITLANQKLNLTHRLEKH